jgi:DNA-binding NarL/FixJ family response regulator
MHETSAVVTRVVVVDRFRTFAGAVATRLGAEQDLEVVGVATSADDVLRLVTTRRVDVVVMDANLGEDGIGNESASLARQIWTRAPATAIVAISEHRDVEEVRRMLEVGCLGWVPKDRNVEDLLFAIRGAAQGRTYLPYDLLTALISDLFSVRHDQRAAQDSLSGLTQREAQVLDHLATGLGRAQIAQRLRVSPNTVRTHIQSILHKLSVHSTLAAVAIARQAAPIGAHPTVTDSPNDVVDLRSRRDHRLLAQT